MTKPDTIQRIQAILDRHNCHKSFIIKCFYMGHIKHKQTSKDANCHLRKYNFGRRKNDPAKDRKALETYVSLRGYRPGEIGKNHFQLCQNGTAKSFLDEIAKELNMSKRNLQRALRIERSLTDSMKEL